MSVEQFFQGLTPAKLDREKRRMQKTSAMYGIPFDVVGGSETVQIEEPRPRAESVVVPMSQYPGDVGAREASTGQVKRKPSVSLWDRGMDALISTVGDAAGEFFRDGSEPPPVPPEYWRAGLTKQIITDEIARLERQRNAEIDAGYRGGLEKTNAQLQELNAKLAEAEGVLSSFTEGWKYDTRQDAAASNIANPNASLSEQRDRWAQFYARENNQPKPDAPPAAKGGPEQVSIDETASAPAAPMQTPPNSETISLADSAVSESQPEPAAVAPTRPAPLPSNPLAEVNVQTRQRNPRSAPIGSSSLLPSDLVDRPDEEIGAEAMRLNPELINSLEGNPTLTKAVELVNLGTMTKEQFSALANRELGAAIRAAKAEANKLPAERIYAGRVNGEQVRLDETGYRDAQRRLESGGKNLGSIRIAGEPEAEMVQYDAMTPAELDREALRNTAGPAYRVAEQIREQDPNAQVQMVADENGKVRQVQADSAQSRQVDLSALGSMEGMDREVTIGPDGTTMRYKTPTTGRSRVPSAVNDIVGNAEKRISDAEKRLNDEVNLGYMTEEDAQKSRAALQSTSALIGQLRAAAASPEAARKSPTAGLAVALAVVSIPGLDPDRVLQALSDPAVKKVGDEVLMPADVLSRYGLPNNFNEILGQYEQLAISMQSGR